MPLANYIKKRCPRCFYINVMLFLFISLVCITSLEVALRTLVFDPNNAYIRTPGWAIDVHHNDLLPNVEKNHRFVVNRYGIRGELPTFGSDPKIAIFGGSTVEDWVLPNSQTWVQQFEKNLRSCVPNIWVGNFGKGGVNSRHHLIQLPELIKYAPQFDMIVVLLGLNDFLFDLKIHHSLRLSEGWWREQAFMSDVNDEGRFATVALMKRLYNAISTLESEQPASDFGHYQKHLRDSYARVIKSQWVHSMPDLAKHLATYRETISKLKYFADNLGIPIVFVSQPYAWSEHMSPALRRQIYAGFIGSDIKSPDTKWYTPTALAGGLKSYNDTLLDKCKSDDLLCVDAERKLPKEALYYYDEFHFSALGAEKVGNTVAEFVRKHLQGC